MEKSSSNIKEEAVRMSQRNKELESALKVAIVLFLTIAVIAFGWAVVEDSVSRMAVQSVEASAVEFLEPVDAQAQYVEVEVALQGGDS